MNETILDVNSWNEPTIDNFSYTNSINIAQVKYSANGKLNGTMSATYVLHYKSYNPQELHTSKSTFSGFVIFEGEIYGKKGSVVFEEKGEHSEQGLYSKLIIKENTATGDLININGSAQYTFCNNQVILTDNFKV